MRLAGHVEARGGVQTAGAKETPAAQGAADE